MSILLKQLTFCFLLLLSIKGIAQVKDSVIYEFKSSDQWQNTTLIEIKYNKDCEVALSTSSPWDSSTASWAPPASTIEYSYSSDGNLSETLLKSRNSGMEDLVNSQRYLYTYQNNNLKRSYTWQIWDVTLHLWINKIRLTTIYDKQENVISEEQEYYNNNKWEKTYKESSVYNIDNLPTTSTTKYFQDGSLERINKRNYSYSNNNLNSTWIEYVNYNTGSWEKNSREINNYTKVTEQYFNTIEWINSWQYNYEYNKAGMKTGIVAKLWINNNAWETFNKSKIDYYNDGSVRTYLEEWLNSETMEWSSLRSTYTNHSCNLIAAVALPASMPDKEYKLDNNINTYQSNNHQLSFNSSSLLGKSFQNKIPAHKIMILIIPKQAPVKTESKNNLVNNKATFSISPNPAKNYFLINNTNSNSLNIALLTLTDASGKVMLKKKLSPGNQKIDIASLQKGVYFVTIVCGKEVYNQKLIAQ
jgi:hypothetical protein